MKIALEVQAWARVDSNIFKGGCTLTVHQKIHGLGKFNPFERSSTRIILERLAVSTRHHIKYN